MKRNTFIRFQLIITLISFPLITQGWAQNYPFETCSQEDSAFCKSLSFPENWKSEKSRKIEIPIKVYKAKNQSSSIPIVWLSGGPGQTNLDYVPPSQIIENHDVILMGYRGIDGSVLLDCPEISKAFKGTGKDLHSQESIDNIKEASKNCADRLLSEGIDLNGYTIEQVLQDIDSVRKHFELDKINLLSASYGTRVAQMYAKYHPENVDKSVMIGAGPPGRFVWEPEMIDQKIGDYDVLCQNDPYCREKSKDLRKTFDKVFRDMPKRWLFIPIDIGKVKVVTFGMLYNKDTAIQVIDSFLAAEKGDYSGIALMSVAYNFIVPKMMVWGDFLSKGMIDYDSTRDYRNEFTSSQFVLGSPMSSLFMDIGKVWPTKQPSADFSKLDTSMVETLILNGALDFSTPHENVQKELMPFLRNGELIIFEHAGHVPDLLYRKDIKEGLKMYYMDGEVQFSQFSGDTNFDINNGFPRIAKISAGIIGIALAGFLFGGYKLLTK